MIGRTISHYRIDRLLGSGGMGEVFLARDLALGRAAAVKVLPGNLDEALKPRLLLEAEACARLQHPAIATFYEAGESDGVAFLAMEYVPGQTLRDRLLDGPVPYRQAVSVAAWLLEALGHAHAAGILHRDIKPENVMVTGESSAKLLDFGIAKSFLLEAEADAATAPALTAAGEVVGTIGYMSPEQLKGLPLDTRSDLFSVGAVLYEALTGERAFPGRTAGERMAAILSRDPTPLRVSGAPPEMSALIGRALSREPSLRYPSAASFLSDLRRVAAGEFVAAVPDTLAVMDFENLSRNPDDDWIGSGVAESVAAELTRVPKLSVAARARTVKARKGLGEAADALDLGHALACRWVLSGSYQRVGPALRMTWRLVEVATGCDVATEKLDGKLDEIFSMQDRLASATAAVLNLKRPEATTAPAPPSLDAFESHARGSRLVHQLGKGTFDQARELFEQAIVADPKHAPSLAGLAAVHALRFTFTTDSAELDRATGYAERSIAADPKLGEPHIWLGYALWRQWKVEEAFREERKGMELDPANPFAAYFAGWCRFSVGDPAEALPFFQRAVEVEPEHGWAWIGIGISHAELGNFAEACWSLEKAVALEAKLPERRPTVGVAGYLGECLRRMGDPAAARVRCLEGIEAVEKSDHMYRDTFRGVCLTVLGRTALDEEDVPAARAAFAQAVGHLRGRPRALGGGHLLVQALAGLSRAGEGTEFLDEASRLFENRRGFDFSFLWCRSDDLSLFDLSRAARAAGRREEADALREKALAAGSFEARQG